MCNKPPCLYHLTVGATGPLYVGSPEHPNFRLLRAFSTCDKKQFKLFFIYPRALNINSSLKLTRRPRGNPVTDWHHIPQGVGREAEQITWNISLTSGNQELGKGPRKWFFTWTPDLESDFDGELWEKGRLLQVLTRPLETSAGVVYSGR
jgi:hypothetical protein